MLPLLHVENRQRAVKFDLPWLRRFGERAIAASVLESGDECFALRELAEVEVAIVSDRVIAGVHRKFMQIDGATDVITFHHGEIVISAETARSCATELQHSVEEELGLYIIHGLLHLNGFDDHSERDRARMHATQNRILQACLMEPPRA